MIWAIGPEEVMAILDYKQNQIKSQTLKLWGA